MARTEPLNEEAVPYTEKPRGLEVEDKMAWIKTKIKNATGGVGGWTAVLRQAAPAV